MPITRRKRANPPDQPENNHDNHQIDQPETPPDTTVREQTSHPEPDGSMQAQRGSIAGPQNENGVPAPYISYTAQPHTANGDRAERHEQAPSLEGGRRIARGEVFRRPPQPPQSAPASVNQAPVPTVQASPLQPPAHEITLPLGRKPGDAHGDPLHLAYNPGYTGSEEVRSALLHRLAQESKNGGRARCWNCGSLAIVYDRWNTRSKTFGEIGIAYCEICGVWSVM